MTLTHDDHRSLPLLPNHSRRNAMTCLFRCGNACAHPAPNTSDNEYFGDMVNAEVSRRGILRAAAAGALVIGAGAGTVAGTAPAAAAPTQAVPAGGCPYGLRQAAAAAGRSS